MIRINNSFISTENPPYIIAEISANHNGSLDEAKSLILAACRSGARAVKLQTYTADSMTIDCEAEDFKIYGGLWHGRRLYELYKEGATPYEWHPHLYSYAKSLGIDCFSTPFDEDAVAFLEELSTPAYKISSFELLDHSLLRCVASTKKPVLMSTGMASDEEIGEALEICRSLGNHQLLLFHCISGYPTPIDEIRLDRIKVLAREFNVVVGLSDHTLGTVSSVAAVALGAVAIEKHFIRDRTLGGLDASFSIQPEELGRLVNETNAAWKAVGRGEFKRQESELENRKFRRSLYFMRDMKEGELISYGDIRAIRPGYGLPPKYYDALLGRRLKSRVSRGQAVGWHLVTETLLP